MSKTGWLYDSPLLYSLAMRYLYGKSYLASYQQIADFIKPNSSILDVCCGDGQLYEALKNKKVNYLGLDLSKKFIKHLKDKSIPANFCDVQKSDIPRSDYIVLQRSLYQFENPEKIVQKLLDSTNKKLIIAESINNLGDGSSPAHHIINIIIPYFVGTNHSNKNFRYNEKSFKDVLKRFSPKYRWVIGKRDLIAIISKK